MSQIHRLKVQRGSLTEFPIAEKVRGGWQNGVTFYPDAEVVEVMVSYTPPTVTDALSEYLDRLPTHIQYVPVPHIRNMLAGRAWHRDARDCCCTPAIAGISDGPNVDCPTHGDAPATTGDKTA